MRTRRNKTARLARSHLKSRFLLVTVAVLTMVTALSFMSLLQATTPVFAVTPSTVVFDFDTGSTPPSLYQNTPFNYSSGGVTARFSSPSDFLDSPTFSVADTVPAGYNLSMFSGKWLYDNKQSTNYLDIKFNAYLYSINLTLAVIEHEGGQSIEPCYINLTAYMDSTGTTPVGWTWARGVTSSPENSQGSLSFDSGSQPFNLVRVYIPPGQPAAFPVTDFFVDNIVITATPAPDTTPPVTTISLSGTLGNQGWYTSDVTIGLAATDVSGVSKTEYSFDNTNWMLYQTPFILTNEGTTTVFFNSTDNAGNIETTKSQAVKIDKSPSATTISLSGVSGNNGWYTSAVTVTLAASDTASGVASTEYSFDNAAWIAYTAPFTFSVQGTSSIYSRSTDVAGNLEAAKVQTVKVDTDSPVTTISLSGNPGDVTIILAATDSVSGIAKTEYSFDNAAWSVYTVPFKVTNTQTTTVYYKSTDAAGNVESTKTKTITGDITPPSTSITLSGVVGNLEWYKSNVDVTLSATDDWSGVAKTEYSFDNAIWTVYSGSFTVTNEGTSLVYYRSTDTANNAETTRTQTVKIDKTSPTGFIVINNGDASATSTSVTLTLTSNDATSGISEVRYSNDGVWDTEQWETTSATKAWTLTDGYGTKTVHYQIKDNAGLISETYQDSITLEAPSVTVDTTKPVAKAGPDQAVTEDTIMTFDGSASTDNVAVTSYTWKFIIESTLRTLTGVKPTYTFSTPGPYTITLNVTDAAGNWATDTMVIEVIDTTNPVADAGQDRTVTVNETVTFDASASTDNVGIVSYTWDCGDGTNHTGETITHTFNAAGTYIVTLTAEDASGNMANHSITVTVLPAQVPIFSPTSQVWIILVIIAIGVGATAALLFKRRK